MPIEKKQDFKPSMPNARIDLASKMVRQIGETIYLLDITIESWNEQLKRAQPHRNGRIILSFTHNSSVTMDGERKYEVEPVVGKMVKDRAGEWRFFKLTSANKYHKLSDLRVGQRLPSDALVTKIIDNIELMLKERDDLVEMLTVLSRGIPGKLSSIQAACARRSEQVIDLADRVKLDWTLGAEKAETFIREERKARYARIKAKRVAGQAGE